MEYFWGKKQNYVGDTVVTYKTPWKPLTLMYNLDYGHEDDLFGPNANSNWYGHAGYARIDLNGPLVCIRTWGIF